MARDVQRSKVYKAEDALKGVLSKAGQRFLVDEARLLKQWDGSKAPAIESVQSYVDDLVKQAWFQRRFGRDPIEVRFKANGKATGGYSGINMPPWARTEETILHEVAHTVRARTRRSGDTAPHGPEYVGVLLTLVRYRMGEEAYKALRAACRANKVRVDMSAAPAPTRPVVTETEKRVRAAAAARRPIGTGEARDAAAIIRRAVASGKFGPAGRKPRAHALETARALEAYAGPVVQAAAVRRGA